MQQLTNKPTSKEDEVSSSAPSASVRPLVSFLLQHDLTFWSMLNCQKVIMEVWLFFIVFLTLRKSLWFSCIIFQWCSKSVECKECPLVAPGINTAFICIHVSNIASDELTEC